MVFITYRDSDKQVDRVVDTQAKANTRATATAGVSAHTGDITTATLNGQAVDGVNITGGYTGWYRYDDGTVQNEPLPTDNNRLKNAFRNLHQFYDRESNETQRLRRSFSRPVVELIEDEGVHLHEGAYAVAHSDSYSKAQKLAFAQNSLNGASDAGGSRALLIALETLHRSPRGLPTIPDKPIVIVNPSTGAQLTIAQSLALSDTLSLDRPAPGALIDGGWIDSWDPDA